MLEFLLGLFGNVLAAEIGAWCRSLAQKIVCVTVRKLPQEFQSRMLEEWSALLNDMPGDLSKLWMAISLYWKRSALMDECENLLDESSLITGSSYLKIMNRSNPPLRKRFVDIVVSIYGLLVLFPLFVFVAVLIKIDSPGPVFYRQVRVGMGGRPFWIWKFRSLRQDAERLEPQRAQAGDSRVSRVGWWLRRSRIDQFPQLVNVLKGEMSLIGPRPERPVFVHDLRRSIPFYDLRHTMQPGITGWAQVKFRYGAYEQDAHVKFEYDLYYVKRWSFWIDMRILVETVRMALVGKE